jgi:hypothetical protein
MRAQLKRRLVPVLVLLFVFSAFCGQAKANPPLQDLLRIAAEGEPSELVGPLQVLYLAAERSVTSSDGQVRQIHDVLSKRFLDERTSPEMKKKMGEALAQTLFLKRATAVSQSSRRLTTETGTGLTHALDMAVVLSVWMLPEYPETFLPHLADPTLAEGTKLKILEVLRSYWNLRELSIQDPAGVEKIVAIYQAALMGGNSDAVRASAMNSIAVAGGGYYFRDRKEDFTPHGKWWVMDKLFRLIGKTDPPSVIEGIQPLLQSLCSPARTKWEPHLSDPLCDSKMREHYLGTENPHLRTALLGTWTRAAFFGKILALAPETITIFETALLDASKSTGRKAKTASPILLEVAELLGRIKLGAFSGNASALAPELRDALATGAKDRAQGRAFHIPTIGTCPQLLAQPS